MRVMKVCMKDVVWVGPCVNGVKGSVVEWVKRNALRWFDHMEKKKSEEFWRKYIWVKFKVLGVEEGQLKDGR